MEMAKNWWFKFDFRIWRTDTALRRCSFETRAFWIEALCVMHETDSDSITGSCEEIARIIGCETALAARCIVELKRTKTADVTDGHGDVTLTSRRLYRELNTRKDNALRKRKQRGEGNVTTESHDRVISKSKSKSKKEEIREEVATATEPKPSDVEWIESLQQKSIYSKIDVKDEYERAEVWAEANNRKVTRRFFVGWLNRAKPMDIKATKGNSNGNGYDPKKDIMSAEYEMPNARTSFEDAADYYFISHHNDGTREKYDGFKTNWLDTSWAKGYEFEIEDYERRDKFRKRFSETG